jgi:DNA modification methylase
MKRKLNTFNDEEILNDKPLKKLKESNKKSYKFITGDCLNELKEIEDEYINLVITSPPYNIGKEYEVKEELSTYLDEQKKIIEEIYRILKKNGSICWQVGNYVKDGEIFPLDIYFYQIFKEVGFKLRNRIIWTFGHGLHCQKRLSGRYETVLWFTKTDEYTFNLDNIRVPSKYPSKRHFKGKNLGKLSGNPKGKNPSDVWLDIKKEFECCILDIPNVKSNHCEKTKHPCQFPIELVERFILALSNENEIVLDPFCGVGSSIIASIKQKRKCIGIDKEEDYIKIAKERIENFKKGELKIREIGTKVYDPSKSNLSKIPDEWKNE